MAALTQPLGLIGAEGGTNPLLQVTPGLALWTILVFLVVFFVLRKWGFGMMIAKLDQRDQAIRGAIEDARRQKQEAEKILVEQQAVLNQARRDASGMIAAAQEQGERERKRIATEAREEYEKTVARGRAQIEQETRAALTQIRGATASLALDVAGKLIRQTLDQPGHKELAERFVREIEQRQS